MNTMSVEFNQSLFNLEDPHKSYLSQSSKGILKKLSADIKKNKKLFLLTGERHCGKKTLVQRAAREAKDKTLLVTIDQENLSYEELINSVGVKLKDNFSLNSPLDQKLTNIKDRIKTEAIKHVILLIDQSLKFQPTMLGDALNLINSAAFSSCTSHLVITGLPQIEIEIKESKVSVLSIRDINLFQIKPLSKSEIRSYINSHLTHLKEQGEDLFSDAATKRIIFYSKGLPGLINRLCNLGLLTANIEEKSTVTEKMMDEVLENSLFLGNEFDYVPPTEDSSGLSSLSSFTPQLNQDTQTQPSVKKKSEDFVNNDSLNPNLIEKTFQQNQEEKTDIQDRKNTQKERTKFQYTPEKKETTAQYIQKEKAVKQEIKPSRRIQESSEKNKPRKNGITVDISYKSILISAFGMGMISAALIATGLNYFDKKNINFIDELMTIAGFNKNIIEPEKDQKQSLYEKLNTLPPSHSGTEKEERTFQPGKRVAARNVEAALEKDPINLVHKFLQRAEQQLTDKKLMTPAEDNAWATYKKILEISPDNEQAHLGILKIKKTYINWAKTEMNNENTELAVSFLKKALDISPDDTEIIDALRHLEKDSALAKNAKYTPKIENDYYKLLEEPNGISKLLIFAENQIAKKNLTQPINNSALSIYKLILDRFPKHKQARLGVKKIKDTYLMWARHEIKQGNFSHAEFLYGKALEVDPSDPEIISKLDQLRRTTGNF